MRKGTDLIGKPIVSFDTGEQFETIRDLVFDQNTNQLLGFVVDDGGWFSSARVLPLNQVQAIGPDAVIVPTKKVVASADTDPRFHTIMQRNNILKGTKIVTTDGRDLGTLTDLYFDEKSGTVEGYEASGGVFADVNTGRSFVPAPSTVKIGEDVAFVPPEVADMMEEQVGGLKGVVHAATEQLGDVSGGLAGGASAASPPDQIEQTRGRRAMQAVRTAEGLMIAAPGQIVTEQVINRARLYHAENDLLAATGIDRLEPGRTGGATRETPPAAEAQAGVQQAKQGVASVWEKIKERVSSAQERTNQQIEEQRIHAALGRPTDRVILDPQDNVILNAGEIITNQAVSRARETGVLDILLNSVSDARPEIKPEDLKAPQQHGEAALQSLDENERGEHGPGRH